MLRCAGSIEKHQICKFRAALILIALLALFGGFGATTNGARVSRIKVSLVLPRLRRLSRRFCGPKPWVCGTSAALEGIWNSMAGIVVSGNSQP